MTRTRSTQQNSVLISLHSRRSPEAEAFKVLRSNLHFLTIDKEVKSLLITSTAPDEGKSTISANLALTLAQTGKRVLLIDCDLRMPMLHKIFKVSNFRGLTNLLADMTTLEEAVQEIEETDVHFLSAGPIPPNPAELLASDKMTELLNTLKASYDYVLVDAPPVLAVTDAVLLSPKVDGVILVSAVNKTRVDRAKEARDQLYRANARILGVVLNGVERTRDDQYYYYYYGEDK